MPLVQAWKCPRTGKYFEDKDRYRKHLRKIVPQHRMSKLKARAQLAFRTRVTKDLTAIGTFADLEQWLVDNGELLIARSLYTEDQFKVIKGAPPRIISAKFDRMYWSDTVSNTHSAPKGKRTNWAGREPGVPRGYPGWHGQIICTVDRGGLYSVGSEIFRDLAIHTGTGGAGGTEMSYDVKLFAEEWPTMAVLQRLQGDI